MRTGRPRTVFLDSSSTYDDIHWILSRDRGSAKTHKCKCGNPAYEWAYQHTGETVTDERGREFARDLDVYAPMCRSCHRLLDEKVHPGSLGERGKKGLEKQAALLAADPSYGEARRTSALKNVKKAQASAAADPEQREKASRAGRLGGLALSKKAKEDPELKAQLDEARRRSLKKANAASRSCAECGRTSTPGGVGVHQHYSGHKGTA